MRTLTPDLSTAGDQGLHDHAEAVAAAVDTVAEEDDVVLVGHNYAGLVVREAADARSDAIGHIVLVDGWAGPNGSSMFSLATRMLPQPLHSFSEPTCLNGAVDRMLSSACATSPSSS